MIDDLSGLDESELLIKIGMDLAEKEMLIGPLSKQALLEKGQNWFEKNYTNFEKAICLNEKARSFSNSSDTDTATVLAAIADLISSICIGVPPFTVAQLLLKRGLKVLCKKYWK